jgi:Mannosyltransferase (PIG-V)
MDAEPRLATVRIRDPRATLALGAVRTWVAAGDRLALARILGVFVLTRLTLFLVAACALRLRPAAAQPPTELYLGKSALAAWIRWDAWWYLSIAERGYWFDPTGQSNVAFFPLFPLLIRAVEAVIGNPVVAGLLIANVAGLGAAIALWTWVREEAGEAAAGRAVLWLAVFPFSFFFHTVYAEPLFFLLVTLAFIAGRQGHWPAAGLFGGLAAATRPMGILLFPAFAWALGREWRVTRTVRVADGLGLLLVPAGLGVYLVYLWAAFGNPLAFWDAHTAGWNVRFHWDLSGYWRETIWLLTRGPRIQAYTQLLDALRVVLPVCFIALSLAVFRRLGAAAGIYTAGTVAVAILFAPESVGREFLAAVPAFAAMGFSSRGPVDEGLRLASFGVLLILLVAFVTAHFVG